MYFGRDISKDSSSQKKWGLSPEIMDIWSPYIMKKLSKKPELDAAHGIWQAGLGLCPLAKDAKMRDSHSMVDELLSNQDQLAEIVSMERQTHLDYSDSCPACLLMDCYT